jgi:integrase
LANDQFWRKPTALAEDRFLALRARSQGQSSGAGPLAPWTFHDFRRSFATWLADNGVDFAIIDLCLAHALPLSQAGKVYQRSYKIDERRQALERFPRSSVDVGAGLVHR